MKPLLMFLNLHAFVLLYLSAAYSKCSTARWLPLPTLPKEQKERLYVSVRELASCSSDSQAARECVHGKEMRKRLSNITVKVPLNILQHRNRMMRGWCK